MSLPTIPRLSTKQMAVLADLPEPSGKNKRTYDKLADPDIRLVVMNGGGKPIRTEDGDELLARLRAEGLVPEAEDVVTATEQLVEQKEVPVETPSENAPQDAPAEPSVPSSTAGSGAETATCRFCEEAKPTTPEFWYRHKASGLLHTKARCKVCGAKYRADRKAAGKK